MVHEPSRGVPQPPSQCLGFGDGQGTGQAQQLEPAHQVAGEADDGQPGPVGVEVGEGEPAQSGVLQPTDVVLDVGMARMWASRTTGLPSASV